MYRPMWEKGGACRRPVIPAGEKERSHCQSDQRRAGSRGRGFTALQQIKYNHPFRFVLLLPQPG